jgi:hypothetical protein
MPLDPARMKSHVETLAKQHNITILIGEHRERSYDFLPQGQGRACVANRQIQIHEVVDEKTYVIALHEIGHIVNEDLHGIEELIGKAIFLGMVAFLSHNDDLFDKAYTIHKQIVIEAELSAHAFSAREAIEWTETMNTSSFNAFMSYVLNAGGGE